jgi:hypothetical protein
METKEEVSTFQTGIWRETEEDGLLQFSMYTMLSEELEKKELKDWSYDSDKDKLTLNISKPENFPDAKRPQRFK